MSGKIHGLDKGDEKAQTQLFKEEWKWKLPTFLAMHRRNDITLTLAEMNYSQPTEFQKKFVAAVIDGSSVFACGLSGFGMGKRLAIALAVLGKIDPKSDQLQAIVVVDTVRLDGKVAQANSTKRALKLAVMFDEVGVTLGVKCAVVVSSEGKYTSVNGTSREVDANERFDKGTQILVGDSIALRRALDENIVVGSDLLGKSLELIVVDDLESSLRSAEKSGEEYYRERASAFKHFMSLTGIAKVAFISERMTSSVEEYLREQAAWSLCRISCPVDLSRIRHLYFTLEEDRYGKLSCAASYIKHTPPTLKVMLFVQDTTSALGSQAYQAANLACGGDDTSVVVVDLEMSVPVARDLLRKFFSSENIRVLIATDRLPLLMDRGDWRADLVINFELPTRSNYGHRIGQAGFAGNDGIVLSLIKESQRELLKEIEEFYGFSATAVDVVRSMLSQ